MSVEKKSRIAIVTGAGTGIGKAAALALLGDGWNVVLAGRRLEPLEQVAEQSGAGAKRKRSGLSDFPPERPARPP